MTLESHDGLQQISYLMLLVFLCSMLLDPAGRLELKARSWCFRWPPSALLLVYLYFPAKNEQAS